MDRELFEKLVEEGLLGIPEGLRERLENVEVVIEDEPSPALLDKMGVRRGGTLLGLYQGVPITSRGFYYGNVL
ncbi:MAG TPA: metallopeptidase family protein, partial [Nitrospirota bacterium]